MIFKSFYVRAHFLFSLLHSPFHTGACTQKVRAVYIAMKVCCAEIIFISSLKISAARAAYFCSLFSIFSYLHLSLVSFSMRQLETFRENAQSKMYSHGNFIAWK